MPSQVLSFCCLQDDVYHSIVHTIFKYSPASRSGNTFSSSLLYMSVDRTGKTFCIHWVFESLFLPKTQYLDKRAALALIL